MKKKLSLLFISLLLCFGYVNAESMEDKVSISSGGKELVGYHWVQSYTKKSTSIKILPVLLYCTACRVNRA